MTVFIVISYMFQSLVIISTIAKFWSDDLAILVLDAVSLSY